MKNKTKMLLLILGLVTTFLISLFIHSVHGAECIKKYGLPVVVLGYCFEYFVVLFFTEMKGGEL